KLKGRRTIYDRLTGVACIGDLTDGTQLKHVTQVEACEYGWWYTAPVPGNRVSAVLMSDADIVSRKQAGQADAWQSLLNDMPLTRERVRGVSFSSEPRVFSAVSSCLEQVGGATWTAVGDAAASHDPLSSTGIPHAIGSGVHGGLTAASVLYADGRMMEAYQQSIQNDFQQYLQTHWRYYQKENRWPESLFWKRRRTPVSLDAEAELAGVHAMTDIPAYDPVHLSYAQQTELLGHCRPGRRAHEVVRAFTHQHPEVSDQQIILGLQELVGNGQVDLMSALQSVDKP
ncbi:MAG: tryptophan 7-halogenase, partial [Planctomycetota bacterium]